MAELIEAPDGETLAIQHLSLILPAHSEFAGVRVVGSLPSKTNTHTPPGELVVVRGTGGAQRDLLVSIAQLTFTSWAAGPDDELRASAIARRVDAIILAAERDGFVATTPCSSVQRFALPYPDPDPVTGRSRYSATYAVALRGRVV